MPWAVGTLAGMPVGTPAGMPWTAMVSWKVQVAEGFQAVGGEAGQARLGGGRGPSSPV